MFRSEKKSENLKLTSSQIPLLNEKDIKSKKEFKSPEQRIQEAEKCYKNFLKSISLIINTLVAIQTHVIIPFEESAVIIKQEIDLLYESCISDAKQNDSFAKYAREFLYHLKSIAYEEESIDKIIASLEPLCDRVENFKKVWNENLKTLNYLFKKDDRTQLELRFNTVIHFPIQVHDAIVDTAFPPSSYRPPSFK